MVGQCDLIGGDGGQCDLIGGDGGQLEASMTSSLLMDFQQDSQQETSFFPDSSAVVGRVFSATLPNNNMEDVYLGDVVK
ncbi:hypothetical protein KUCAC02_026655, partial [Chaenocephalus aceratus]